ncbi:MAG TPA: zf-HC2 domain-containing protein [Pseudomonadota bacterium]|nr:zf-HC2 domain-containing protein [Pseudomonadota bacterium]HNN52592.1 zf-HC2 domain-containing protein [Pseudomonadota bacterium]
MSEQCKYDEQVLDYLYGELAEAERAEFANHLATCASCRLEIESLSGVRKKASSLPRPELTSDAAAKMRAQLMEAAIAATKDQKQSLGGGKLIAFPTGRVRRFMTHPATALVTVAAAALFLVVFKGKDQPAPVLDSPLPVAKIEAPAKLEPAAAPSPTGATPPATQVPVIAEIDGKPSVGKTASPAPSLNAGDVPVGGIAAKSETISPSMPTGGVFDRKLADATARTRVAAGTAATTTAAPASKKPMVWGPTPSSTPQEYAKSDRAATERGDTNDGRRFAQPPPPPAAEPQAPQVVAQAAPQAAPAPAMKAAEEEAPGNIVEQSKARQHKRTVDELERGELAQAPSGAMDNEGYARRPASTGSYGKATSKVSSLNKDSDDDLSNVGTAGPGAVADKQAEKNNQATPIAQVYEQIRAGHCTEARDLLAKLERSSPSMTGLADANTAWQRDCGAKQMLQNNIQQQNGMPVREQQLQQNYQNLQQRNLALPPAPSQAAAPAKMERSFEPMEQRRAMAKKAAPLPAPPMKAKAPAKAKAAAADAAY